MFYGGGSCGGVQLDSQTSDVQMYNIMLYLPFPSAPLPLFISAINNEEA